MEDVRPTARWGYRMLRPLKSIYHRLEKYRFDQAPVDTSDKQDGSLEISYTHVTALSKKPDRGDGSSAAGSDREDPSWIPGKSNKRRVRHKYTARSEGNGRRRLRSVLRSPEVQRKLPGAIEIGTPLITGRLSDRYSNDVLPSQESDSRSSAQAESKGRRRSKSKELHYPPQNSMWHETLNRSGDPNFKRIVQSLNRVFFTFLAGTRVHDSQKRPARGPRSLLSMAARRLPEFIAQEQRLQDELDEDEDVDMEDAYFTELEALYAPSGTGWQPLREAVRAQGIHLVADMIRYSWLTDSVIHQLLRECIELKEFDAFETLFSNRLTCLGECENPQTSENFVRCNVSLKLLHLYYKTNQSPYVFDELARALSSGVVPLHGLIGRDWDQTMHDAIGSLSRMDSSFAAAARLIEAVILWGSGIAKVEEVSKNSAISAAITASRETRTSTAEKERPVQHSSTQDAISNLILSLVTALCSMHIVRSYDSSTVENSTRSIMRDILSRLTLAVEREVELRPRMGKNAAPTWQSLRRGSILVGNYLMQCTHCVPTKPIAELQTVMTSQLDSFFRSLAEQREIVKEMSFLIQQVIHCCERAITNYGHYTEYIDNIFSCFTPKGSQQGLSLFLGKIAVEVAMDLAEVSQDSEDHARAAELQEKLARCHTDTQWSAERLPHEIHTRVPYRWEESIGEWVASTPLPKIRNSLAAAASKPLAVVPYREHSLSQLPSSIESSSSASEDDATSVTSSPPSSIKRSLVENATERGGKRLRTTRFRSQESFDESRESSPDDFIPDTEDEEELINICESSKFDDSDDSDDMDSPSSSRRIEQRRLRCTPRNLYPATDVFEDREEGKRPKIEVVIVHKTVDEDSIRTVPIIPGCRGRSIIRELPSAGSRKTRPLPCFVQRTGLVIPCSRDDSSEDELSFL